MIGAREIIDISPRVGPTTGVWPGDVPLRRTVGLDLDDGDALTLSSIESTVHLGAHADAPSHTERGAPSIEAVELAPYLGLCTVVDVGPVPLVTSDMVPDRTAERVLFKTSSVTDIERVESGFSALHPDLVDDLADRGALLVGIDTPSVDPFESKDLPAHARLVARDVRNLENLVLDGVTPGEYELIALPLPWVGFDASPVRAVLRPPG